MAITVLPAVSQILDHSWILVRGGDTFETVEKLSDNIRLVSFSSFVMF